MNGNSMYEEHIVSKWTVIILGAFAAGLFIAYLYQVLGEPLGTRPAPDWFLLGMSLFFLAILLNFYKLRIRISGSGVSAGYGVVSHSVDWDNIQDCYVDKASTIQYGGWGIRLGRVKGKWRLAYNTLENPRVVVKVKQGRFSEFVFSTSHPDQVAEIIGRRIGRRA